MPNYAGYDSKTTQRLIKGLQKEDAGAQLHGAIKSADPKMKHAFTPKVAKEFLKRKEVSK